MKILFLDIDGVMNGHNVDPRVQCGEIHPYRVKLLNIVLEKTGAKIVLSSAWRYLVHNGQMTLEGMDWLLRSHGVMAGRLAGVTCVDTMIPDPAGGGKEVPLPNERGDQMTTWIEAYAGVEEVAFAAIDDIDLGITAAGIPLVLTDGEKGMTMADAESLIWMLGREGAA